MTDQQPGEIPASGPVPGPVAPAVQRARWEALVAGGGPVLADGAMGTMDGPGLGKRQRDAASDSLASPRHENDAIH